MDELDDYIKSQKVDPDRQKIYQAAGNARKRGVNIPDDVTDEFYDATKHESGRSHFNPDGSVKLGGLSVTGGRAIGYSQVMPDTARPYQKEGLDPYKELDNIEIGLREFYNGDPNDSVARRLAYVGGPKNGALRQYRQTGTISDARMYPTTNNQETYRQYVEGTGGLKGLDSYIKSQSLEANGANKTDTSIDDYIKSQNLDQPYAVSSANPLGHNGKPMVSPADTSTTFKTPQLVAPETGQPKVAEQPINLDQKIHGTKTDVQVDPNEYDESGNLIPPTTRPVVAITNDAQARKGVAETVHIKTKGKDGRTLAREVLTQLAPKHNIDVEKVLAENPDITITPTENDKVDVTYDDLNVFLGGDENNLAPSVKAMLAEAKVHQQQNEPYLPPITEAKTPIVNPLTPEEEAKAGELGRSLLLSPDAGITGGALRELGTQTADYLSGMYQYTLPGLLDQLAPHIGTPTIADIPGAIKHGGAFVNKIGEAAKRQGAIYDVGEFIGETGVAIPRYVLTTAMVGGNPIVGMAAEEALRSKGRNEDILGQGKALTKGAILGAIFAGSGYVANKLGGSLFNKIVNPETIEALNNPTMRAAYDDAIAAGEKVDLSPDLKKAIFFGQLAKHGTKLGIVSTAGFGAGKIEGKSNYDAAKQGVLWAAQDLVFSMMKEGRSLSDLDNTIIRVPDETGKPKDVLLIKGGDGIEVTDIGKVADEAVSAVVLPKEVTKPNFIPKLTDEEKATAINTSELNAPETADERSKPVEPLKAREAGIMPADEPESVKFVKPKDAKPAGTKLPSAYNFVGMQDIIDAVAAGDKTKTDAIKEINKSTYVAQESRNKVIEYLDNIPDALETPINLSVADGLPVGTEVSDGKYTGKVYEYDGKLRVKSGNSSEPLTTQWKPVNEATKPPAPTTEKREPWQMTQGDYAWHKWYENRLRVAKKIGGGGNGRPEDVASKWATRQFLVDKGIGGTRSGRFDAEHKQLVERALSEGKPVPANVLADYPDLKPTEPSPPTASNVETKGENVSKQIVAQKMGDFYEFFDKDAETASRLFNITLTKDRARRPMAGVPSHAFESYKQKAKGLGIDIVETGLPASIEGENISASESTPTPSTDLRVGDRVQDTFGRKGTIYAEKDGTLHVEQNGTKARLPLSEKWKKTTAQKAIDRKTAKEAARRERLAKKGQTPVNEIDADLEGTGKGTVAHPSDPIEDEPLIHYEALSSNKNVRMLMSDLPVAGYEKGKASSTDVIKSYENVLNAVGKPTPIRTGRGNFAQKQAEGFYKTNDEVIRIRSANNIPTASHEVFHAAQKYIYGQVKGSDFKQLPVGVKKELVKMGRDLYGTRKPAAGYGTEGFAEFGRHYLTGEDAERIAPHTFNWFTKEVLPKHPAFAKALTQAKEVTTEYRMEGAVNRAKANTAQGGTVKQKVVDAKRALSHLPTQMVDEFTPLLRLSKDVENITGKQLAPEDDPFKVASFLRGSASATTHYFVFDGTLDFARNKVGPPLEQAFSTIRGRKEDFSQYMMARRAQELLAEGINPGMTAQDAQTLIDLYDSPKFQLAAEAVYRWNNDVLGYVKESSPEMATTIDKIFARGWKNYVPLMREFDDVDIKAMKRIGAAGGNPLKRIKGSGRRVKDIFPQIIANAEKLIALGHRQRTLDTIVRLSGIEGMGHIIEEVPVDKIPHTTEIEAIRKQLEDKGADLSSVDTDELVTFFAPAYQPKGQDPIVPIMKNGKMKWFQVNEDLYNTLNGLDLYRMPKVLDLILGVPTRTFRLGTTGLRPAFSLITNPTRDIQTFAMQSQTSNPAKLLANYVVALGQAINPKRLAGKRNTDLDLFYRLSANLGQPLGVDTAITRRTAKELFDGKVLRVVKHPIEMARELLSVTESVPRVAEIRNIAQDINWNGRDPLTFDQAVQLGLGAKQVTVDFSAAGSVGKKINQAVPFFNANVQGTRQFAKNVRDRPGRTALYGLLSLTLPTLFLWWKNKDKEWYKDMPSREKYMYWNIEAGDQIIQIPRAFEYGNTFSVVPETLADAWYTTDPKGTKDALGYIFDTTVPPITPQLLQVAKEEWQNRIDFFDRPIVPKGQEESPPGEQYGPGTTEFAKLLGRYFPNTISPVRVDHITRGLGGGTPIDLQKAVEQVTGLKVAKQREASDIPAIGKLFRYGGTVGYNSKVMDQFYKEYGRLSQAAQSKDPAIKNTARGYGAAKDLAHHFKLLRERNADDPDPQSKGARNLLMRELARKFLADIR